MANVNRPRGFVPVRHLNGSPWNHQTQTFLVDSGDGTAIYVGDVVKTAGGAGAAAQTVFGMDVEGVQTVIRASAGTTGQDIVGVVVGFSPNQNDLGIRHRAASTSRLAYVVTDPTVVYEVQEDADTTPIAAASIGLNVAYTTTAGSTVTGQSGEEIDSTSAATAATLPFKIVGLVKRPDNALNTGGSGTDKAKFEVVLNTGLFMPNTAGA